MTRCLPLAAAALVLAGLAGCAPESADEGWVVVGQTPAGQGDVSLYRDVLFEDIPIPEGYVLDRYASYSFQGSMFRQGLFHFYGGLHWLDAVNFYRDSLPGAGWIQDQSATERGLDSRVLHFRKGPEKLIVVVRQQGTGSRTEMQLDNIEQNDLLLRGKLATE